MTITRICYSGCFLLLFCFVLNLDLVAQQQVKVACIGNSVTFGLTHKNPRLTSYPSQLQVRLGDDYLVQNFGVSGTTLLKKGHRPYFKESAFSAMLSFVPDIAIIHLGLNDTDPRDWPNYSDDFLADYSWLIDTIRKTNPSVKIFVCKLSPISSDHPRFKSGTRDWYWQIQSLISKVAGVNNTGIIDFNAVLYPRPDLLPDGLHPNEEGSAILANTAYQKITGNFGGLKLSPVFASHMVLQREKPIKFYGTANRHQGITITFAGQKKQVITDENGKWMVVFPLMKAGGPYVAKFEAGGEIIAIGDILIGEVWLCAGQSNMNFPLKSAVNELSEMQVAESSTHLRFLQMQPIAETNDTAWDTDILDKINKLEYFQGTWQKCDSTNAAKFSAVAYYFGRKLQQQLKVPIGLIQVAVGGSTTESWIDRFSMEHDPVLVNELADWKSSDFFQPWTRERAAVNLANSSNLKQRHPYEPCYNYEAGIRQFIDFPIQGVIWYQGESNAHNVELHAVVFQQLVKSWRKQFGYSFPFYYVQLSSIERPSWPSFRFSQLELLRSIPNTGMAVSSDLGDPVNVHPREKKPVGERLARLALHFTYKNQSIIPYGPMPLKAIKKQDKVIVTFNYTGGNLTTPDHVPLRGFKLVNNRGEKVSTKASINKDQVVILIPKNQDIVEVLYAWDGNTDANLFNTEKLPASTFRLRLSN
jgi:sialate O-acetylesterase